MPFELAGDRYRYVRDLGEGVSKQVAMFQDNLLHRPVAVAMIRDAGVLDALDTRVLRELRTTAQLGDHPNVVTVYDVVWDGEIVFVVSQLVRGGSIADRLRDRGSGLPIADAVRLAREIAAALAHAHAHGVIHRDVKPSNVLLADDGSALLTDFGIALLRDRARLTVAHGVIGTPAYMAPEQAEGRTVDERSDLYALGAVLFEMACGRPPFTGGGLAVLAQHVYELPPDPRELEPAVPDALAELILRLLSKRPEDRPGSAEQVRAAVSAIESGAGHEAAPRPSLPSLPQPLLNKLRWPFVGRTAALETLRRAWAEGAAGRPSIGLLSGEPGIGKTRLAATFAEEVHTQGALVLYGRCDEDPLVSYQPFVEALRQLVADRPGIDRKVDPRLEPELAELSRLVPELRRRAPAPHSTSDGGGGGERYLLFEAVVALLTTAAAAEPLLLVLDDLHWADEPTILLLRHLMRVRTGGATMVLGTTRDDGLEPDHPLVGALAHLRREQAPGQLERIALAGLDAGETGALVGAREERRVEDEFVRLLHEETAGNPFFIEEILRALSDEDISGDAAGALRSLGVPAGAQEVIQRRLERLSAGAADLLTQAAVCGREFRLGVLAELRREPDEQVLGSVEEAIDAGLVVETGEDRFTFCHALVRDALYGRIGTAAKRARAHLAVGNAVEALGLDPAPVAELAHHFHAAAAVGGAEKGVRYALAAADGAAEALAYEDAARYKANALEGLQKLGRARDAEACRVLHSLGRLQWQAGSRNAAQKTFKRAAELARSLGDAVQFARSALGFAGRWYDADRVDPARTAILIKLLEDGLEMLPPGDSSLRAQLMAALADALQFSDSDERAEELSRDALAMVRRSGDRDALIGVLGGRHMVLLHIDHLEERLAMSAEWLELAEHEGHEDATALALTWRIYDLIEDGDVHAARALHERLATLAGQLRQPLYQAFAASWDFNWLELAGQLDAAAKKAADCFRYARRAQGAFAPSLYGGQLFALYRDRGRLAELVPVVEPLVGRDPRLAVWRAALLLARIAAGEHEAARAELAALADGGFAEVRRDGFWLVAMCVLAEASSALGDRDAMAALAERLEPHAKRNAQIGLAAFLGPVDGFLGLLRARLGELPRAERHFEAALARSRAMGALIPEAHAECEYGQLLLQRAGSADRGRDLLEHSLATAKLVGAGSLERRAEEALELARVGSGGS